VVVFPRPDEIASGCTASVYQKILWFVFELIWVA